MYIIYTCIKNWIEYVIKNNSPLESMKSRDAHSGVSVSDTSVKPAPFLSSSCLTLSQLEQPSSENTVILPMTSTGSVTFSCTVE